MTPIKQARVDDRSGYEYKFKTYSTKWNPPKHIQGIKQKKEEGMNAIYDARIKAGLSQAKLAKLCGWEAGRQSRLESGKENPTVKTLERIAKAINRQLFITFIEGKRK